MDKDNPFYDSHFIINAEAEIDRWRELLKKYGVDMTGEYTWKNMYVQGGDKPFLQQSSREGGCTIEPYVNFKIITLSDFDAIYIDQEEVSEFQKQLNIKYGEGNV